MSMLAVPVKSLSDKVQKLAPVRAARALHAFATIARDPNQLGKVFELRSSLEDKARLEPIVTALANAPGGRKALADRPRIGTLDLGALAALPPGTLGERFARHMLDAGLDPAAIPTLEASDEGSYVSAHFYETHDIWHAVTGFETDVAGELGLQAFYLGQFPAFLSAAILSAGLLNTMLYAMDDRDRRMLAIARGFELGHKAKPLFGVAWAERWSEPLEDVRASLGIPREGVSLAS